LSVPLYNKDGMPTAVRSHAKINLGLYIGAPRPDGYHALATVYQTLELHDLVSVTVRPGSNTTAIHLSTNDARVPTDERNTAWKMIHLVLEELGMTADVEVHIEKRLPIQGGLGAGSGNAVAALVGLEAELGIMDSQVPKCEGPGAPAQEETAGPSTAFGTKNAPNFAQDDKSKWPAKRMELAAQVGSDVPLFLIGGAVLGRDRGQQVDPLPDFEPVWCVVATPEVGVSTPQAFRDWDSLCLSEGLTARASADKLEQLSRAYASAFAGAISEGRPGAGSSGVLPSPEFAGEDLAGPMESALVRTGIMSWIENDFERVVFPQHPSLAEIKRILLGPDTPEAACHDSSLGASLSGSGSALFGLYGTRGDAEAAQVRLKKEVQGLEVRSTLTRTLPRSKYWREMLLP
jgi:4-diphosphocytidyl-2-C-methyl-D-erythritol kinase